MQSRYDWLDESKVLDIDQQAYPDPLTINYNIGTLSKVPTEYRVTTRDLMRFWTCMWEQYQMNELDDLWLNINGVRYIMDLQPNDVIYKPVKEDLIGFITNKQLGTEE